MIINFFKAQQPLAFIILPLALLVIWIFSGLQYFTVVADNGMPLYSLLMTLTNNWPAWLLVCLGYLLVCSQCLHLNTILNKYEVLYKASYLPALFFLLFSAILPQFVVFHPLLFVNTIMLFVFEKILRLYKSNQPLALDFDACLLISMASLFYFPAALFAFLFFISLSILKPFSWRDWVVGLLGLLTPYFFTFVIFFLKDQWREFLDFILSTPIREKMEIKDLVPKGYQLTILVAGAFFLAALLKLRNNFYKNDIRTRNFQQVIIIFILTSAGSALLTRENMLFKLNVMTIPFSVIVSNYFLSIKKRWWAEILFYMLLATLIFNYLISF